MSFNLAPPPFLPFVWRCVVCPQRKEFGTAVLDHFTQEGWPVCCGQVVLCFPISMEPADLDGEPASEFLFRFERKS